MCSAHLEASHGQRVVWVPTNNQRVYSSSIYDTLYDFKLSVVIIHHGKSMTFSSHSLLARYARACSSHECFIVRDRRLSNKLLKQGYAMERLELSFGKFYGQYMDRIKQYNVANVNRYSEARSVTVTTEPIRIYTHVMTLMLNWTFTELWEVSMEHLQRVWHASRERLPSQTPKFPFLDFMCSYCWHNFFAKSAVIFSIFFPF